LFFPVLFISIAAEKETVISEKDLEVPLSKFAYLRMFHLPALGDTVCFIHQQAYAYKTLMYGQWSVAMLCALLAFACVIKNIWSKTIARMNLTNQRLVLGLDMISFLQTILMFFVIGVCWMFLLLYLIPDIQNNRKPPDSMDYAFSTLKFVQVLVLFIIVVWNYWSSIKSWLKLSSNSTLHNEKELSRGLNSVLIATVSRRIIRSISQVHK